MAKYNVTMDEEDFDLYQKRKEKVKNLEAKIWIYWFLFGAGWLLGILMGFNIFT